MDAKQRMYKGWVRSVKKMRYVFAACDMTKPASLAGQAPDTVLGQNGGSMAPGSRGRWGVRHLYEWKEICGARGAFLLVLVMIIVAMVL